MPDVDTENASLEPKLSCEVCKKEIPRSTARRVEGDDYVFYFCGLKCYSEWQRAAPRPKTRTKRPEKFENRIMTADEADFFVLARAKTDVRLLM